MVKVLLVSFFNDEAYGVRAIHSNLEENGIDAYMLFFKLIDSYRERSKGESNKDRFTADDLDNATTREVDLLVSHIKQNKYDVVGFSLVSQHFTLYKRIYSKLKNISDLSIVIGGWQASLNPNDCIGYADFLCIGEGEDPMFELVRKLGNKEPVENIDNFWVNTKIHGAGSCKEAAAIDNHVTKNSVRPLPRDLSSFPGPLFDHKYSYVVEDNIIKNYDPYFENTRYGTFIGRGCPYKCTYCSNSYMANEVYPRQWTKVRHRSITHLQKELLTVKERLKNVKNINFYDEVFTPKIEWIKEFFSWYKDVIDIPFYVFFYPGTCDDEKARVLAENGLAGTWLGVQSGSERVRKEVFKRSTRNEVIFKQARIFHKYGISVRYDFIFDNPFETFEESLESIYMILELPQPLSLNMFSLKYFPNTEITDMAINAGFVSAVDLDDNQEKDHETYMIRQDKGSLDDRFIGYLVFYISNILTNAIITQHQKEGIFKLIDDYKKSKDIEIIKNIVKPYLSKSNGGLSRKPEPTYCLIV